MPHKRKGSKYWWIRVAGVRRSSETTDWQRADFIEKRDNAAAWDRKNRGIEPEKLWETACLEYLQDREGNIKNVNHIAMLVEFWKPHLAGKFLSEIDSAMVHKIIKEHRLITPSPSPQNNTANVFIRFVKRVMSHSGKTSKLKMFKSYEAPDRYLSLQEWRALEAVMSPELRQIATFSLATGLRQGNVMRLQWNQVKGDVVTIDASETKTGVTYTIPLNKTAQAILAERRGSPVRDLRNVFMLDKPLTSLNLNKAWWKALEASGVEHIKWHGLRHTFASWLAQNDVPEGVLSRLGCWSTKGAMVHRYAHLSVQHLRKWSDVIDTILAQPAEVADSTQELTA
jgi:integrase